MSTNKTVFCHAKSALEKCSVICRINVFCLNLDFEFQRQQLNQEILKRCIVILNLYNSRYSVTIARTQRVEKTLRRLNDVGGYLEKW